MRVSRLDVVDGYQWLTPASAEASLRLRDACGVPHRDAWTPPPYDVLTVDDDGRVLTVADCPWIGVHVMPVRAHARSRVEGVLGDQGEFLDLAADDDFSVFNGLARLDALDVERSQVAYGRRTGKIINVEKYAFRPGVIPLRAAFRLPQTWPSLYFTETVVDELLALDLAGLAFETVGHADA